jgi:hypothetical protein
LFSGMNLRQLGFECKEHVASAKATHIVLTRQT